MAFVIPSATERAWAAGFFDGEGHCRAYDGKYLVLNVVQTETSTLERFKLAVGGFGRIFARGGKRPERWKASYAYEVGAFEELQQVVCLLWQFLSEPKKRQITEAFEQRAKFRSTWPTGFTGPGQKLSDDQVAAIRAKLADGNRSQASIAREYGVSQSIISKIKLGKRRTAGNRLRCGPKRKDVA